MTSFSQRVEPKEKTNSKRHCEPHAHNQSMTFDKLVHLHSLDLTKQFLNSQLVSITHWFISIAQLILILYTVQKVRLFVYFCRTSVAMQWVVALCTAPGPVRWQEEVWTVVTHITSWSLTSTAWRLPVIDQTGLQPDIQRTTYTVRHKKLHRAPFLLLQ